MGTEYLDEAVETITIRNKYAFLTWPDGRCYRVPLWVFRANVATATNVLADYDANSAAVLAFPKRERRG